MTLVNSFAGRGIHLENRALFRISGPDRVRFLNGQVSNDVSGPLEKESVAACLCSLKGKVEALVWVSSDGDSLLLDGEISQREQLQARLERYLIADDCEISDETESHALIHHFVDKAEGIQSQRTHSSGYDVWISLQKVSELEMDLTIEADDFQVAQLLYMVPRAGYEITGAEFPAELMLDQWAVNFHKGCYLGQEIVSRIQSVGRVKRLLRLLISDLEFASCTKIRNELGEIGKITGPAVSNGEKKYLTFGIFTLPPGERQSADYQALSYTANEGP